MRKQRRDNKDVAPELKSRFVGCGSVEETEGLRTGSPTADVDARNLQFSRCASSKVKIKSADIPSAYLQGKEVDRVILYRVPKGGVPEEGMGEGAVIAPRIPINGAKDAGRGFWLKLREVVLAQGYTLNQVLPTAFTLRAGGRIIGVVSSNADDLIYGNLPEAEDEIEQILKTFPIRAQNGKVSGSVEKKANQDGDYNTSQPKTTLKRYAR